MTDNLFAIRLHEARKMMHLSMDKLVELTDGAITKQSISKYEKGVMCPKSDALQALSHALNISVDYFKATGINIDMPMLRTSANCKLSDEDLFSIEAKLSFWAEQYLLKESRAGFSSVFENPIDGFVVRTLEDAICVANQLRDVWHCGDGAIPSILRLLERKGVKILSTELPINVFGLSTWANRTHPLIILDMSPNKTTVDRLRFTVAHELAHLLLTLPKDCDLSLEKRCDKFAGFFLFPKQTFIEEMGSETREQLTLEEMIDLKEQYGVSVSAQVHEAWDLRMITREQYDWWYNEKIYKNKKEIGWGQYLYPETLGREKRINSHLLTL